ncbi:hypothetical protein UPYG_G00127550 [Umbra pygmaea]|uniref:Uncharacterized protein n=1 Tax=Umbra pygmaea TaxID=75934 RepID=A0ABD0X9N7_UMBPY
MSSGCVWFQGVFCLLPSMLLLLLSLAIRWPPVQRWAKLGMRAVAWGLWVSLCWLLELPIHYPETEPGWAKPGDARRVRAQLQQRECGSDPKTECAPVPEPTVTCKPTALAQFLLRHCDSLASPKLAQWPWGDPHLQTLTSLVWAGLTGGDQRPEEVTFTRDNLLLKDGGVVALDWAVKVKGEGSAGRARRRELHPGGKALGCHTSTPPILLLVPHYGGGVTPHLRRLCELALRQGFYALVFHRRGTAGCPLTTPRLTEYGDPADLVQTVTYVRSQHPSSVLVAVSEGSGSGLLLSYLGECGSSSYLMAAACISPVLTAQKWFDTPLPPVYRWGTLVHRKLQLSRYAEALRHVLDVDQALSCSSHREFEQTLFCVSPCPQANVPQPQPRQTHTPETSDHTSKLLHPPGASKHNSGMPARTTGARPGANTSLPFRKGPDGIGVAAAWELGGRSRRAEDWESYWERNEPLRDADEVAVPVLCLCSRDDPLLLPASDLPLTLFQNNPYFLLALTGTGGHCGFGLEEGGGGQGAGGVCWSHVAVLDYFRVVAEFLSGEEQERVAGLDGQGGQRGRTMLPPRRRRAAMGRRDRPSLRSQQEHSAGPGEDVQFTWQRSYTR